MAAIGVMCDVCETLKSQNVFTYHSVRFDITKYTFYTKTRWFRRSDA